MTVTPVRLGRTSFVLDFGFSADGTPVATATTVYVVVATDGTGARPVPDRLLAALGPVPPPAPGLTPPA